MNGYNLEYIQKLRIHELRDFARQMGIPSPTTMKKETLIEISALIGQTKKALKDLIAIRAKAEAVTDTKAQAEAYRDEVKVAMDALRKPVDELELVVDKNAWPIPTYGDLLF